MPFGKISSGDPDEEGLGDEDPPENPEELAVRQGVGISGEFEVAGERERFNPNIPLGENRLRRFLESRRSRVGEESIKRDGWLAHR